MTIAEKNIYNHRAKAVAKMLAFLQNKKTKPLI
jgi:inosine/xanthosine triphosphate pyrophosphatase family protein